MDVAVYCFKKALFLLCAIEIRFGSLNPSPIPIPKTSSLPVFSDNVLPSMLIYLGVIDLSSVSPPLTNIFKDGPKRLDKLLASAEPKSEVLARLPKGPPRDGPSLTAEQAYILRAAAVDACEQIVEVAHSLDSTVLEAAGAPPDTSNWMKKMTTQDIDMWLWAIAKDRKEYRELERFSLKNTVMF